MSTLSSRGSRIVAAMSSCSSCPRTLRPVSDNDLSTFPVGSDGAPDVQSEGIVAQIIDSLQSRHDRQFATVCHNLWNPRGLRHFSVRGPSCVYKQRSCRRNKDLRGRTRGARMAIYENMGLRFGIRAEVRNKATEHSNQEWKQRRTQQVIVERLLHSVCYRDFSVTASPGRHPGLDF